ncbi:MAG: ATP-dependent DNA helicase DinG [Gammaproteobacteria bacterium]|nr:ATP-dependent DNA helicase DinG [Gammaproteobacteria bacterium]
MLTDTIKKDVQQAYKNISQKIGGFRNRYTQRAFIAEIVKSICDKKRNNILVAEGPTGTGKTLAYLLSCIPVAQAQNIKLVISSATVALQSQLIEKDLPAVQKLSGLEFSSAIAKGRGRYLCPSLLAQHTGDTDSQVDAFATDDYLTATLKRLFKTFENKDWNGDKDSWDSQIPDEIWTKISNDRHGCSSSKCHYFRECPYFIAKAKIEDADVIVANHDIILSDLALGGGVLIPAPEETLYVFDEAHHLPDKTINHASSWISISGTSGWLDKSDGIVKQCESILQESDTGKLFSAADLAREKLKDKMAEFTRTINSIAELNQPHQSEITLRFPNGIIPEDLRLQTKELLLVTQDSERQFNKLKDRITKAVTDNEIPTKLGEAVLPELGSSISRLSNIATLCFNFSSQDPDKEPPMARWITKTSYRDNSDYRIFTSPISAASFLQQNLWDRCHGAVLTSATLMTLGSFAYFQHRTGLDAVSQTRYIHLSSPFDFANKSTLWIPKMKTEPQQTEAHTTEIIDLLPDLITDKTGTLVLFSSRRQLTEVAENVPYYIQDHLLIQGDYNIQTLLEKHKEKIENNETSVIFGLASFAEGIDLPGELCTHVIIAKLPFPVPDSPVDATEREYIESQGQNHFREIVLPQTCIRLIQAVGRLIRNEEDSGKVTILDRRLVSKFYGKQLLNALPNMRRIIE